MRTLNRRASRFLVEHDAAIPMRDPRFDRNPGTGKTAAETADLQVQHQSVYPQSFITLPIVPR
jgi:hypothetical protein